MKIENVSITGIQKKAITFFLEKIHFSNELSFIDYDILIKQINVAEVIMDITPYYCIVKFLFDGCLSSSYDRTIELQVIKKANTHAPTVFHMHFNNNVLCEFEYFNGDSSEIYEEEMFDGDVLLTLLGKQN